MHTDAVSLKTLRIRPFDNFFLRIEKESIYVIFLIVSIFLAYSPVYQSMYAVLDDYAHLDRALTHSYNLLSFPDGRPLANLITAIGYTLFPSITQLRYLRLISLIEVIVVSVMLYYLLRHRKFPPIISTAISIFLVSMPPFQVHVSFTVLFFSLFSVILAGIAYFILQPIIDPPFQKIHIIRYGISILFLTIGLCGSQYGAMYFWVFAAIMLMRQDVSTRDLVARLLKVLAVGGTSLFLGFLIFKLGVFLTPIQGSRSQIVSDFIGKMSWFVKQALFTSSNLFVLPVTRFAPILFGVIILIGLFLYFQGSTITRLLNTLICIAMIPLAYIPNLVTSENWASYRTQIALTSLLALFLCLALFGIIRAIQKISFSPIDWAGGVFLLISVFSISLASKNVTTLFVQPLSIEQRVLRDKLTDLAPANIEKIDFIRTSWPGAAPFALFDEFGLASSSSVWAPVYMVKIVANEMNLGMADVLVEVLPVDQGEITLEPNTAVIDMRLLDEYRIIP